MAEIINLRLERKRKARAQKEKTAQDNRLKHGTSSNLRKANKANKVIADAKIDAHILEKKNSDNDLEQ